MKKTIIKSAEIVIGLLVFSFGSYLSIQANIGLAPWDAFSMGVSLWLDMPYGVVVVLVSLAVLGLAAWMHESIGLGTVLNVLLFGSFVGLYQTVLPIPKMESFWPGLAMLLSGQCIMAVGAYLYIHVGLGCGPRDALMIGLSRRLPSVPVGAIRVLLEGTVMLIGGLLGGKIGTGTVVAAFGIGFFLQAVFRIMRFDHCALHQETLLETFASIHGA